MDSSSPPPLVSVLLPCYNQENFIGDAIESAISQDYPNIEIIISDDCSTDQTPKIVVDYQKRYPNKIFTQFHPKNLQISRNMQSMTTKINGKYVAWFAGDDLFLPNKISKQVAILEKNPDATICYHNVDVFDSKTNKTLYLFNDVIQGQKPFSGMVVPQMILNRCFIGGVSCMTRTDALPPITHDERLPEMADSLLWIQIAHKGKVIYLDEVLARYRRHDANYTARKPSYEEAETLYDIIADEMPEYKPFCQRALARMSIIFALKYIKRGELTDAKRSLSKGLRCFLRNPYVLPDIFTGTIIAFRKGISRLFIFKRQG